LSARRIGVPFCRKQLEDLQKELPSLQSAGVRVVAISYDSPAVNLAATKKLGLTYPLLSDSGSKTIDAYGLRNEQAKGRADGSTLMPALASDASRITSPFR
jgi:peroxiredoxin